MLLIRQLFPYFFFASIAAVAYVYGTGFEWTAGLKAIVLNLLIVLFFEKLLGEAILTGAKKYKSEVLSWSMILSLSLFAYGLKLKAGIDFTQTYDEVYPEFATALILMSIAGMIFTFGGATFFSAEEKQ